MGFQQMQVLAFNYFSWEISLWIFSILYNHQFVSKIPETLQW